MEGLNRTFGSDNHAGVHPQVLKWIEKVNVADCPGYGEDRWTDLMNHEFQKWFGESVSVFPVFNGTAANVLALRSFLKPYQSVICGEDSHLNTDECGAPEFFASSKLMTVRSSDGTIKPEQIIEALKRRGDEHQVQPKLVSITQPTELGTVYTLNEIRKISEVCKEHDMYLHMDGARISNAVATLESNFREAVTDVGVDVLSFGGTKNGLMGAEALVVLRAPDLDSIRFLRKQSAQLASKMRFLSAQFLAFFDQDLWRKNAVNANSMAAQLAEGIKEIPQIKITQQVQANAIFIEMPNEVFSELNKVYHFYAWPAKSSKGAILARLMTSFATSENDVEIFLSHAKRICHSGEQSQIS